MHVFIRPTQAFLSCHVCGGLRFASREVKMTTTGMTFFDLDWLNKSADGVICVRCGFVHVFMGNAHQYVAPADVDPADLPDDPLGGSATGPTAGH
jgi:predicted nucleic-acid-binding Zn-ribbon protein